MSQVIDVMDLLFIYLFIPDSLCTEEELYPELYSITREVNETHPY